MVLGRNIKQIVKRKYTVSSKDKKDWMDFIKKGESLSSKEDDFIIQKIDKNKVPKLDLHGHSLSESNRIVKKFIIKSFNQGFKKVIIITGKGLRSKFYDNPYISSKLSFLRYSVPEFIKNNEDLRDKISRISEAQIKDGGEGAIYVFLKINKNLKNKFR